MREICRVFKTLILEVQGDARRYERGVGCETRFRCRAFAFVQAFGGRTKRSPRTEFFDRTSLGLRTHVRRVNVHYYCSKLKLGRVHTAVALTRLEKRIEATNVSKLVVQCQFFEGLLSNACTERKSRR